MDDTADPTIEDVVVDYEADDDDEDEVPPSNIAGKSGDDSHVNGSSTPVGNSTTIDSNNENKADTPSSKRKIDHGGELMKMQQHDINTLSMETPPKRARIDKSAAARMILNSATQPVTISKHDPLPPKASRDSSIITSGSSSYGIYVPPFRRKQLEKQQQELESETLTENQGQKASIATPSTQIQRQKWEKLKKSINGTINRLNTHTIKDLIHALFQNANLIRGKGLLAKALLRAATTSPTYAPVYTSLLAVVNTKLPEIGELVLVRAILTFRRSYARQDRSMTMSITNFVGCLFNQGLCHELLCLQLLTVLLEGEPTDDSVEVAVQFIKVVGMALAESSPAGVHAVMERFRGLLHDGRIGRRVQFKIEELMKVRKDRFKEFPALQEELDLVEREEQITFELGLDDEGLQKEESLDVFKYDPDWGENEQDWTEIRREILGEDSDDEGGSDSDGESETGDEESDGDDSDDDEDGVLPEAVLAAPISKATSNQITEIHDMSEKDLINLRRTIYLTIMSSATFEECSHKLSKMDIPFGKEMELINMIIECCSQERTFLRYYGLIAARFCLMHKRWSGAFHQAFIDQYNTIHRLETNKLRNVAKMFSHLLHTDSLSWSCLAIVHLNEDETTSSSRIFLKILVQEMAAAMGIGTLVKRFETDDPETMEWFKELFPKDNPRKTRYAINFFTSIGLGPLTDGLREHLKNAPKLIMMQAQAEAAKLKEKEGGASDESSVLSSSSSDSSSISSSSVSSSSRGSYSSYSSYSSGGSYTSSSDESSRGRGRRRSKGGRKGRTRSYSSGSSVSTRSRGRSERKSKKGSLRSISRSRSRSAKRQARDSTSKTDSSVTKQRRKTSPIGSEIEVQLDSKKGSSLKGIVVEKTRRSSRSNSVSRSNSQSSSISRDKKRGSTPTRKNTRKRSYSRSSSRDRNRTDRRAVAQKKGNASRRSNYL
jgi:pre-mRNA-splicing factor CWC22